MQLSTNACQIKEQLIATAADNASQTASCDCSPRLTQPPTLSGTGNEHRSKCGDALRLAVKTCVALSICG